MKPELPKHPLPSASPHSARKSLCKHMISSLRLCSPHPLRNCPTPVVDYKRRATRRGEVSCTSRAGLTWRATLRGSRTGMASRCSASLRWAHSSTPLPKSNISQRKGNKRSISRVLRYTEISKLNMPLAGSFALTPAGGQPNSQEAVMGNKNEHNAKRDSHK